MHDPLFAPVASAAVRVALPVPIDSLFDYAAPQGVDPAALVRRRVVVPFSGRRLTGVVVAIVRPGEHAAPAELAVIERVLDAAPVIGADLLETIRAAAERALCPLGLALAPALPPGAAPRMVKELRLTPRGRQAAASGAARGVAAEVLALLAAAPATSARLARRVHEAGRVIPELERDGLIESITSDRGPAARVSSERVAVLGTTEDVDAVCAGTLARAPRQADLLRRVAASGELATSLLARGSGGAPAALRSLVERGFVRIETRERRRDVVGTPIEAGTGDDAVELTAEQRAALAPIEADIRSRGHTSYLLHGVTGSGKTEVYLRAIAAALEEGRQALVLVPEITLTHQIIARLRRRFGDQLAVLHSGLTPGQRLEQWWRLARREVPIAVGARSALFAPLEDPGVIVLDEEHDSAYKNDEGFRYHARDLARARAERAGCPLVLGTATPALETRHAADHGDVTRLVLARRIAGRPLPAVEIVDLTRERARAPRGRKLILTRPLVRALTSTLEEGGQAILFLNRRGFSTQIFCFECGYAERCKNCDVALVYHAGAGELRCHYCDFAKPPPEACGGCGAPDSALLGVGTERLEEELRSLIPDARVARLDRDTATRRGYTESVLRELNAGNLDVLVGTQIVAKGHDFPGVRLVGVIAADLGLHMPDFRASERTFQLLTQVAGRAGRAGAPGRVIVQTFVPDHYAIAPVVAHDYESFYAQETQHRAALGYPPFGVLAQTTISSEDEARASDAARVLAETAAKAAHAESRARVEVLGPAPAPLARLRGRYRFQILLKADDRDALQRVARAVVQAASGLPREVQAVLDVDPVSML